MKYPNLLNTTEAAEFLRVDEDTLNEWRSRTDQLAPTFIKYGGYVRYVKEDLEDWLESRKVTSIFEYKYRKRQAK